MNWRTMTLAEAYPYWVLGEIPAEDLPYIACNDWVAGNQAKEVLDLAALTSDEVGDPWEYEPLLERAFDRAGVRHMSRREAAAAVALERMRQIAREAIAGELSPVQAAGTIYLCASEAGFPDAPDLSEQAATWAVEFLQIGDAAELWQDDTEQRRQYEALILEVAEAFLAEQPMPEWHMDESGILRRDETQPER